MISRLSIRNGVITDVDAITQLINRAFRVERFFVDGDRIQADEVRSRLSDGRFLLAECDGLLVGSVYVEPRGERSYAGLLAVDPSHQRTGIGKLLMATAEEYARALGCRAMDLQIVNVRTELPGFYRQLGYA